MSEALAKPIKTILIQDRRLDWQDDAKFGVIASGTINNIQPVTTSTYSNQSIVFQAQPSSPNIAVSREILVTVQFRVDFVGTAGNNGSLLNIGVYDAPRYAPLAQITNSVSVSINSQQLSMNTYQVVNALSRLNTPDYKFKTDLSVMPSMQDFYQNYNDNIANLWGTVNDPLAAAGQTSQGWSTRGGWSMDSIVNPDVGAGQPATATVYFTTTEPLWLSPFLTGSDDGKMFIGLKQLNITLNLANLSRVWSHNGTNTNAGTITSCVCQINSNSGVNPPSLLLQQITPSQLYPLPRIITYNYSKADIYTTGPFALTGGETQTQVMNNIQLNNVPKRIIVFLRRQDNDATFQTSDTFANISNININFDSLSAIFSNATEVQLYQISRDAGLNMSYEQWHSYTGSIFVCDVGRSLLLNKEADAPSITDTKQLKVTVTFKNLNTNAVNFTMYVCTFSDGLMTINDTVVNVQDAVLTPKDVIETKERRDPQEVWEPSSSFYGGTSFKKLVTRGLRAFNRGLKRSKAIGEELTNFNPALGNIAKAFGYGLHPSSEAPSTALGGVRHSAKFYRGHPGYPVHGHRSASHAKHRGAALSGGRRVTAGELLRGGSMAPEEEENEYEQYEDEEDSEDGYE